MAGHGREREYAWRRIEQLQWSTFLPVIEIALQSPQMTNRTRKLSTPMRELATSVFLFLVVAVVGCAAAQETFRPSGIYSNLSYHEESGDLLGMELLIFPAEELSASNYVVFIQIAEGGAPYAALVPLEIRGKEISLVLPSSGSYSGVQLVGHFRGDELEIRWPGGALEHLRRGHGYWE